MMLTSTTIFVPHTERELLEFLDSEGSRSIVVSGATDLLPRILRGLEKPRILVDMSRLRELRYVRREDALFRIGALTTVEDLSRSAVLGFEYEAFRKLSFIFGSPPVRNLATVGGNLVAASSSEDLIPIFLALDAEVRLRSLTSERLLPISKFMVGKRETARMSNEIVSEVVFKEIGPRSWCTFEKIGRRERLIIALVSLACLLRLDPRLERIEEARIALNRVRGKIPERARKTEAILENRVPDETLLRDAAASLQSELMLTSDFRASAAYRVKVATNFFRRSLVHCKHCIENQEVKSSG